jgi:hypothetical protein
MSRDERIHKAQENKKRHALKSCKPKDSRVVDGMDKLRQSGKGDKYRPIDGWYSDEMTDKLNRIFGRDGKKKTNEEKDESTS